MTGTGLAAQVEDGPQEVTVDAVNRRGRRIAVRVLASSLHDTGDGSSDAGIILTMEETDGAAAR